MKNSFISASKIMLLPLLIFVVIFGLFVSCVNAKKDSTDKHNLISYLDIKVDSMGNLPKNPYIIDLQKNNKHLTVIGTLHSRDTASKMFSEIEKIYIDFKPEIAINEGGRIKKIYTNRNTAIIDNGESGLLKFLCDNQKIKMLNGDMPDSLEFYELSKTYSKDEALFFFASERFILPITYWFSSEKINLDSLYNIDFIEGYIVSEGIKLTQEEKIFSYYINLYEKYFHKEFSIGSINSNDFSPIRKKHHFCDVARKSKELRDKYLLKKIEGLFEIYNKVFVVFGGWHVLAIEPALTQIMNKKQ